MLMLGLTLLLTFVSLMILLWVGTFFFQGYIYTEPTQQLHWQAPAAAALITVGLAIWCFSIALSSTANPRHIPIDTIQRFSPYEDMLDKPVAKLWAIKRSRKKSAAQTNEEDPNRYEYVKTRDIKVQYKDTQTERPWQPFEVIAIEIERDDQTGEGAKMRFDLIPTEAGQYRRFRSSDGWVMQEYVDGPTGLPVRFRVSRLMWNLVFNVGHLLAWFIGLWLLLRFQWLHALGFAVVLWAVFTLMVLPEILSYSASIAEARKSTIAATTP